MDFLFCHCTFTHDTGVKQRHISPSLKGMCEKALHLSRRSHLAQCTPVADHFTLQQFIYPRLLIATNCQFVSSPNVETPGDHLSVLI